MTAEEEEGEEAEEEEEGVEEGGAPGPGLTSPLEERDRRGTVRAAAWTLGTAAGLAA